MNADHTSEFFSRDWIPSQSLFIPNSNPYVSGFFAIFHASIHRLTGWPEAKS
jgi:hypothetical protein